MLKTDKGNISITLPSSEKGHELRNNLVENKNNKKNVFTQRKAPSSRIYISIGKGRITVIYIILNL